MKAIDLLAARGVSRLCHFTKFQSLTHILSSNIGIVASSYIHTDTKNATDMVRYDGELEYICCSVEYPNSWFLKMAIDKNQNEVFKEWVVLYIALDILELRKTKFCPCNASKGRGEFINCNMEKIDMIFANKQGQYIRSPNMLDCCPTDGQAEILLNLNIPRDYISGIAVGDEDMAKRIHAMLKVYNIKPIPIYIAPDVLTKSWSNMVKQGYRPEERLYVWSKED